MGYDLGVDLGTTFVAAAISRDGHAEMCTLGNQTVVSPAVAYLNEQSTLIFGEAAERRALSQPVRVERAFKRRLGDPTPVVLGGVPYQVTALMAAQLRDILEMVTAVEGEPPGRVALTYPANWGPYRRELFEEIPHLAGLRQHVALTEPEAAAAYYGAARQLGDGDAIAVYDLGGGTFDATVLRKHNGGVEVVGDPGGIERLGGIDFDEAIIQWINYSYGGALAELDLADPEAAAAAAKLRQECVLAKEALSVDTETTIPVLLPSRHFFANLTRADFEAMIRAPIESTIGTLVRAVHTARLDVKDLAAVLLVGGSSRIPLVQHMIAEETDRPTVVDAHPKYAVALGAAMVAAGRPHLVGAGAPPPAHAAGPEPVSAPAAPRRPHAAVSAAPPPRPAPVAMPAGPAGAPDDPPPARLRSLWAAAAAVVVALVVIGVTWYVHSRSGSPQVAEAPPPSSAPRSPAARASRTVYPASPNPSVDRTVPLAADPNYVSASPSGRQLYIAAGTAGVFVYDVASNTVTGTIAVPGPAQFLSFSPDGRYLYVSLWDQLGGAVHSVVIVDTVDNSVRKTIPVHTRPFLPAVTPDGKLLYVPNHDTHTITVIDTSRMVPVADISVPMNPHYVSFSVDGTRAYVACHESNLIAVLGTANRTSIKNIGVGHSPHSVEQNPKRPMVINVNYDDATVSVIDTTSNTVRRTIKVGSQPKNVNWSPDGRFAYVANSLSNNLSVISADSLKVTSTLPTGKAPSSITVLPDGATGYISNSKDHSLTVVHLSR